MIRNSIPPTLGHTRAAPMADTMGICAVCGGLIGYVNAPTGGWWAHDQHPEDNHDAVHTGQGGDSG